jgi:hypothetical protein
VEVRRDCIMVDIVTAPHEDWTAGLASSELAAPLSENMFRITCSMKICTRRGRTWLIQSVTTPRRARPDRALISSLRRAHAELRDRGIDIADSRSKLDHAKGMGDPYLRKLSGLAFLAPDIQRAILEGRQPAGITLAQILAIKLPLDWQQQRELLGFA